MLATAKAGPRVDAPGAAAEVIGVNGVHVLHYQPDPVVAVDAGRFPGGVAITKPLVFNGDRLEINASTGAGGGVRVGFMDAETMKPMKGFEESSEFYGDQIQYFMHFGKRRDISSMAGRQIRLKLSMYGADLYSLKFSGK